MEKEGLKAPLRFPRVLWRRECPLCSSINFEVAEDAPLDSIIGLLALYPVRCVNCCRRYYWLAKKHGKQ